jgi:DNA-binding Lrp family transcriptional regulator
MRLGELLDRVPGLEKRFVYYLEAQGVVRPRRLPKARIDRRDYSSEDERRIRRIWRHYRRGYSLSASRELAEREASAAAFALVGARPGRGADAVEALSRSDRILEAAVVYGVSEDLVVRIEAARDEDVLEALHGAFDRGVLTGLPTVLRTRGGLRSRGTALKGGAAMLAFVLMRVPAKRVDETLTRLTELEGIVEASAVYGETDIIAKIEVATQAQLDDLIIGKIQGLPEVEATRTYIVVGGLHWTRGNSADAGAPPAEARPTAS